MIEDLGTVFDVSREGQSLDVQVAEGSVLFQPGRDELTLKAGSALAAREDRRSMTLSRIAPGAVGGWRSGQLTFTGETLGTVFETIHRLYGTQVTLAPDLSRRPFTGMIRLTGEAERDIPHLAALIGAGWRRDGERWILSPAGTAAP
jgi:transmembrane sensor